MDEFPVINDHGMLLQGQGMFGAEGCLGIRASSGVLSSEGKAVPTTQDDRNKNKGKDMFYSDWPELVGFDDFEPSLRKDFDPTFEIGSNYFEDALWSSIFSPGARLVPSSYFDVDDIDFSSDRNDSAVLKTNPTKTKQQPKNGTSDTPLDSDAHASSSSCLSDAELFSQFYDIELANQIGACEGLEAIFSSSPEMQVPTASSSMCSGETAASSTFSRTDFVAARAPIPCPSKKPQDPFSGAPDTILEEMAENPLDMYFPPLATYEQPEMVTSDTASAQKHRFPEEFAGSYALNCAESQFRSKEMTSAGFHWQPSSAMVLQAAPVKDLGFQKLQEGMNQLDLATKGRIRDALYRLANRVEQRHCVAGSKRLRPGGWTETQTDPMDQSVAQLLLQKPSYRKTVLPHRVT
ncbi:unnamed protein product [Urochloa decumbens]|uniref:Uncharacterized protein n=1 Tax=Urochloa decumbens TaxID=240449 RepID=A0ABC9CFV2_9POAL